MTREDIIRMAREAGIIFGYPAYHDRIEHFAALVAAAERKAVMQLFTDPENQPTQHGTVTVEYMQREIAAEREACAKVCVQQEDYGPLCETSWDCYVAIMARGKA